MLLFIELALALLAGVIVGTFTGLAPGIHINLISALIVSLFASFLLTSIAPIAIVVFLVSMAITHTFVDYIPSVFLGAPDEDNVLSILPGHEMLNQGKAYDAVVYTLYGSISALGIILLFSPLFFYFLPKIYPYAERIMPLILIVASGFLIYFEKSSKVWAIIIFFLSGILGLATFNLPLTEPLLPLFTGLFGVSSLITSINKKQKIPKQKISKLRNIKIKMRSFFKSIGASMLASPLCSFLPGMGSGQAAVIGSQLVEDLDRKEFLVLLGSINTIVMGLSFITLYTIGKSRTGVAAAIDKIMTLNLSNLITITTAMMIAGILAFFVTLYTAKIFSKLISKANYKILSTVIILILLMVNFYFSGFLGILILTVSTVLGLTCIYSGIRRTHMLGCLIIPAILLYLL